MESNRNDIAAYECEKGSDPFSHPSSDGTTQVLPPARAAGAEALQQTQALPGVHSAPVTESVYDAPAYADRTQTFGVVHPPKPERDASLPSSTSIYPEIARERRKGGAFKRVLKVLACILGIAIVGAGAYAFWFASALDRALAPDAETVDALSGILVPEVEGEPYYVLLMGSDSREGNEGSHFDESGSNERSDVMMLMRVDARNKQVTMLSIPRDTPYRLPDGSYVKINELFNDDGVAGAVSAVSELTGLPISHHAEVRVSGLANIVDLLGGVTVDVPIELSYTTMDDKTITIKPGRQTLTGQEAEIFSRARHEYQDNQDAHRQSNVRALLAAIVDKLLSKPITEIPGLVLQIAEYVDTDYKTLDAISLATTFAGSGVKMYSATGPSNGDFNEATGGKWLCYLNPEGWAAVSKVVDAGEDPEKADIDYEATQIPWTEVTDQPNFNDSMAHMYYYGGWPEGDPRNYK